MKQETKAIEILIKVAGLLQEHQKEDKKILAGYTLAANLGEDATEISNEIARLFSSIVETEPAPTPTSKEGLTYKVECLDNSTAHYTHDKKEAYEVYAKFIIDFGDTIRLYEAPMPINDHDEIEWETIECYDADENDSKEGLEDGGFTKGAIFLDEGDFDRNGEPDELYIRGRLNDETFDICNFGCNDTGFALDYATALVARYNQASTLYKKNKEQIGLLKWVVNEIETTPDELSDALLGMIKIKCNQLLTRINKD